MAVSPCRPAITTDDDGSLKFTSTGNIVFEAGESGQVQFMASNGPLDVKGEKVRRAANHAQRTMRSVDEPRAGL